MLLGMRAAISTVRFGSQQPALAAHIILVMPNGESEDWPD